MMNSPDPQKSSATLTEQGRDVFLQGLDPKTRAEIERLIKSKPTDSRTLSVRLAGDDKKNFEILVALLSPLGFTQSDILKAAVKKLVDSLQQKSPQEE